MDLTAADLKDKVFEPVVKDILDLIRTFLAQVGDRCMAMFLIGQFGASEYVSRRVREELKSQIGLISYPQRWELAISRGAVYAGLDSYMRLLERHVKGGAGNDFEGMLYYKGNAISVVVVKQPFSSSL
ncbi:MAG: hypothetical protein JOS17DRAFT_789658 [Linnemannia elongata]|nr:MAG: hypothetical protein JOS17DRAFT_789658 [Linnemannia elongata]